MKKYWSGLILLIFIGGILAIGQFYDFKLMIIRKSNLPIESTTAKDESQQALKIAPEDLQVNLENLSEREIAASLAYLKFQKIKSIFFPSGVPEIYGKELNISFDEVQDAINKVAPFDPTYGQKKITLTGADLERYIKIGSQIACEFCCGAQTLVFENGEAACGCDHSQMMRGLAAYLIKNHPEVSDEEILKELSAWKITYFPKQTLTQELDRRQKAGESGIKELLEEFPEFLPQMVGGC